MSQSQNFVDLRDVAAAHLLAVENDQADGRRFTIVRGLLRCDRLHCVINSRCDSAQTGPKVHPVEYPALIAKADPELIDRLPVPPKDFAPPETYDLGCTASKDVLGLKYHSAEETLGDTARWIIKVSDFLKA
jgi:nucleoside-diphosphate-sugar epimerase